VKKLAGVGGEIEEWGMEWEVGVEVTEIGLSSEQKFCHSHGLASADPMTQCICSSACHE